MDVFLLVFGGSRHAIVDFIFAAFKVYDCMTPDKLGFYFVGGAVALAKLQNPLKTHENTGFHHGSWVMVFFKARFLMGHHGGLWEGDSSDRLLPPHPGCQVSYTELFVENQQLPAS